MSTTFWDLTRGDAPILACAIHNGHDVRPEVSQLMALPEADRLRDEDPYTGQWTAVAPTRLVVLRSRFEVDLNRPREKAVYLHPDDCWGLHVWRERPPRALLDAALARYDEFYSVLRQLIANVVRRFGRCVVLDLHSYNHRRQGIDAPFADPAENPEVNVGTGTMNRQRWAPLVDRFLADLRSFDFLGRRLDVRENVRFQGGNLPRWVHDTFPDSACALAVEIKKFFMDEWTGEVYEEEMGAVRRALESTIPGLLEALRGL